VNYRIAIVIIQSTTLFQAVVVFNVQLNEDAALFLTQDVIDLHVAT